MIKDMDRGAMGPVGVSAYEGCMVAPAHFYAVATPDPNWKSQKTRRKNWRRLSNTTKAVKRRLGFKECRG